MAGEELARQSGFVEAALKILSVCQLAFLHRFGFWLVGFVTFSAIESAAQLFQAVGHGKREIFSAH